MKKNTRDDFRYYDRWTVPNDWVIANGVSLKELVFDIQNLIRMGQYELVFSEIELLLSTCTVTNKHNPEWAYLRLLLGITKRKCGQLKIARQYISLALKDFKTVNDTENSIRCLIAMGDTWRAQALMSNDSRATKNHWLRASKFYDEAKITSEDYLERTTSIQNTVVILLRAQILWAQARVDLTLGKVLHLVEASLLEAWNLSLEADSIWAQEEAAQLLGRYYEKVVDIKNARKWYNISLKKAKESSNVDRLIETYLYLAKLKEKTNDFISAHKLAINAEKILSPLLEQNLPENHQFFKFQNEIMRIKKNKY